VCVCVWSVYADSQMIDMCRTSTTYTDEHGAYLVTPDFPFSYSAGRHCSCTVEATAADRQLAVEFVHVRLRQHDPTICHDFIDVQVGHTQRLFFCVVCVCVCLLRTNSYSVRQLSSAVVTVVNSCSCFMKLSEQIDNDTKQCVVSSQNRETDILQC